MDQPVRQVMQVKALGGDIRAEQHPQRRLGLAEVLYQVLLFGVGQAAVQYGYRPGGQAEVGLKALMEEVQGFDAFAEDHQPIIACRLPPAITRLFQQLQELLVLAIPLRLDLGQRRIQGLQTRDFVFHIGREVAAFQHPNPRGDRLPGGGRTGK